MSRIGRLPIKIEDGVTVTVADDVVTVKGKLGTLSQKIENQYIKVAVDGGLVHVTRENELKTTKAAHGLYRALIANMVEGVTKGYSKVLLISGVGYKAQMSGKDLVLNIGYSHPVVFMVPDGIKVTVTDGVKILIEGFDKQLVGECAARIRRFKKPEPYKGKGIRYADEHVVIKPGKTNA